MVTAGYGLETSDGVGRTMGNEGLEGSGSEGLELGWYLPYPVGFQASLTAFLLLELVLGLGSNLTVLALYCAQCSLVDSVSNLVTANLHVVDVVVCAVCLPLTTALVLLPPGRDPALLCRLHEACVAFAGVATAANVLVVSVDRYDISVRPACRLLTPRRAALLLATVWASSLAAAALPFLEAEPDRLTLLCLGRGGGHAEKVYYHLVLQVPIFLAAAIVMLVTYAKILRALNIRIGSRMRTSKRFRGPTCGGRRRRRKRKSPGDGGEPSSIHDKPLSPPPIIPSATPTATSPPPLSSAPLVGGGPMGVGASVSAIIALRRAVRRHRDRRERRRRVLRMSLIIVCSFLGCWVPLMAADVLVLSLGPGERLARLRLCLLVLAYGTTVFHPLLYAFTRQKLRRALRAKVKRRVVTLLQVDPAPGSAPVHNSWVEPRQGRKPRQEGSDATDRCLTETVKE